MSAPALDPPALDASFDEWVVYLSTEITLAARKVMCAPNTTTTMTIRTTGAIRPDFSTYIPLDDPYDVKILHNIFPRLMLKMDENANVVGLRMEYNGSYLSFNVDKDMYVSTYLPLPVVGERHEAVYHQDNTQGEEWIAVLNDVLAMVQGAIGQQVYTLLGNDRKIHVECMSSTAMLCDSIIVDDIEQGLLCASWPDDLLERFPEDCTLEQLKQTLCDAATEMNRPMPSLMELTSGRKKMIVDMHHFLNDSS